MQDAVSAELTKERHWPPENLSKKMGTDYQYSDMTMKEFLHAIQLLLSGGNPSYHFSYDEPFVNSAIASTVVVLMQAIVDATH